MSFLLSLLNCFGYTKDDHYNLACLERISKRTVFQMWELEALHELFAQLSKDTGFKVTKKKWEHELGLSGRLFDMFDTSGDGLLDFEDFACGLSLLHPETPKDVKTKFMFDLYDKEGKGYLELQDLEVVFLTEVKLVGCDTESVFKWIVKSTFEAVDVNGDGRIDQEEWSSFVEKHPIVLKPCTVYALKDITALYPGFVFHGVNYELETVEQQPCEKVKRDVQASSKKTKREPLGPRIKVPPPIHSKSFVDYEI